MIRWKLIFTGNVQGVGFRFTAFRLAKEESLTGWVDSMPDGTMEMEVQGEQLDVLKLLQRLANAFQIKRVDRRSISPVAGEAKFKIRGY